MGQKITEPSVGVVVVAFNDPRNIARVLASLIKVRGPFALTVCVVDNSTHTADATKIRSSVDRATKKISVEYYPQTSNLGFAGGVNAGLRHLKTDYYWLINSDTTVEPAAITYLIETARATGAAAVGSRILYADDKTIYYAGGVAVSGLGIVRHPHRNRPANPHDTTRPVTFVNGCAMFLPAATITKHGMFYEPYFMYYEETDLCARIIHSGGTLYYEPRSVVYHHTNHTDNKSPLSMYFLTRNHWLYISRNLNGLSRLTARCAVVCFQLYRYIRYMGNPPLRQAIVAGWRDALTKHYGKRDV